MASYLETMRVKSDEFDEVERLIRCKVPLEDWSPRSLRILSVMLD